MRVFMSSIDLFASYLPYKSSLDTALRLYARFEPLDHPASLLLLMHGWHGNVKSSHRDNVTPPASAVFFRVQPEMRGRGDSSGRPDANGLELQDAVDTLDAARALYPNSVADVPPRLHGGSGGGGNVLGVLGKFPDLFASAVCESGISDYALWYCHDTVGEFRDEMNGASWIGGDPQTNPEAYLSRGGRTTAMNLLTPLLMIHGTADERVPFEQAEAYMDTLSLHGKENLAHLQKFTGVGKPEHFSGMTEEMTSLRKSLTTAHHHQNSQAPLLPKSGKFVVAGYLKTSRFEVHLENVDQVALLEYNLNTWSFLLHAPTCKQAILRISGESRISSIPCCHIPLADFCRTIGVPCKVGTYKD